MFFGGDVAPGHRTMNFLFDRYTLDLDRRELRNGDQLVSVEPQVFDLLEYLIRSRDRVVSKDDLFSAVWNGRFVSESTLNSHITSARLAIGDTGEDQRLIRTLRGKGFRFVGPVQESPSCIRASDPASAEPSGPLLALPDKPSVAVLPFHNLSGDPEEEYFGDGVVEDIITGLCRIKWLFVIARNSSFTYKGRVVGVKQIGRELGVRYVLEGGVRRSGTRLRITAQLIEAATGNHLWAERYDRNVDDVFSIQDEITVAVVGAIEPSVRAAEIAQIRRKRPESLDAYDLTLRALSEIYTAMPAGAEKCLTFIERSLVLEPNYGLAHSVASWAHEILFVRAGMREENRRGAIDHGHAAIAYGRSDPMALTFGGFSVAIVEHDRITGFDAFEEAVRLCPSFGPAYMFGCVPFAYAAQAERAIDWGERALRLSPFDPLSFGAYHGICVGNFHLCRYEQAANAGRKAVQSNPAFSFSYALLAAPLTRLRRMEEAKAAVARLRELQPNFSINRQCEAVGIIPVVAEPLIEALRAAGLPD